MAVPTDHDRRTLGHPPIGFAIAPPNADDPPPNRTKPRKPESQIARKSPLNPRFLAKTITSDPRLRRAAQRLRGSSRRTIAAGTAAGGADRASPDPHPRPADRPGGAEAAARHWLSPS